MTNLNPHDLPVRVLYKNEREVLLEIYSITDRGFEPTPENIHKFCDLKNDLIDRLVKKLYECKFLNWDGKAYWVNNAGHEKLSEYTRANYTEVEKLLIKEMRKNEELTKQLEPKERALGMSPALGASYMPEDKRFTEVYDVEFLSGLSYGYLIETRGKQITVCFPCWLECITKSHTLESLIKEAIKGEFKLENLDFGINMLPLKAGGIKSDEK